MGSKNPGLLQEGEDRVSICFKMVVIASCLKQTIRNLIGEIIPVELQTIVVELYKTRKPSEDQNM